MLPGAIGIEVPLFLKKNVWIDFRKGFGDENEWSKLLAALVDNYENKDADISDKRSEIKNDSRDGIRRAVSLAVVNGDSVLLVKRASDCRFAPGLWQLPGGKVDDGENSSEAVIREAEEEIGILFDVRDLMHITDLSDVWLDKKTGKSMLMSLYMIKTHKKDVELEGGLDDFEWVRVDNFFLQKDMVLLGVNSRLLRIVRRYLLLYVPLMQLAEAIENCQDIAPLPGIKCLSHESTQILYALLGLLGFIDDNGIYRASSILSASIIRTLAAWSTTENQIFEAQGDSSWYTEAVRTGHREEIDRFRSKLFEEHESILGLLSHRLTKALSCRFVGDILLSGTNLDNGHHCLLIRWDLLAKKFQIPAKGLEMFEDINSKSIVLAQYIVAERIGENVVELFDYKYLGSLNTNHVSAGSLEDGPIMRNYQVLVYGLEIKANKHKEVIHAIEECNEIVCEHFRNNCELTEMQKRFLLYYIWVDVDVLLKSPVMLFGKRVQGFDELHKFIGDDFYQYAKSPVIVDVTNTKIPVISNSSLKDDFASLKCIIDY